MRRYLIASVAVLLVGVFLFPTTALAKQTKVDLCHFNEDTGMLVPIRVPERAATKHLAKHTQDVLVGDGVDENCDLPEFAIAYSFPGLGDLGFNDSAHRGVVDAEADFGVQVSELTTGVPSPTPTDVIAQLSAADPSLIFGVGLPFADAVATVAPSFPDTNYVVIDAIALPPASNVKSVVFNDEEAAFLVGAAAALTSTSDHVGFIGGVSGLGLIERYEAGFTAGVLAVSPGATVDVTYLSAFPDFSGFSNPAFAYLEATDMYLAGADVIYHASGASGQGLFVAARDYSVSNPDVWAIGVDTDQYLSATPDIQLHILTSSLKRFDTVVYDLIAAEINGDPFVSGTDRRGLKENSLDYSTSGLFVDGVVPQLEAFRQDIIDGTIVVPTVP